METLRSWLSAPTIVNTNNGSPTTSPLTFNVFQAGGDPGITAVAVNFGDGTSDTNGTALPYADTHAYTITNGLTSQTFQVWATATNASGTGPQGTASVQILQSPTPVLYVNGQIVAGSTSPSSAPTVLISGHTGLTINASQSTGYIQSYTFANYTTSTTYLSGTATSYTGIGDAYAVHNQVLSVNVANTGAGADSTTWYFTISQPVPVLGLSVQNTMVNTVNGTLTTPSQTQTLSLNGGDTASSATLACGDGGTSTSTGSGCLPITVQHAYTITNGQTSQAFNVTGNASNDGGAAMQVAQQILVVQSPMPALTINGVAVTEGAAIRVSGGSPITLVGSGSTGYIENYLYQLGAGTLQSSSSLTDYTAATASSLFGQTMHFTVSNTGVGDNSSTLDFTLTPTAGTFQWTGLSGTDTHWTSGANWDVNNGLCPAHLDTVILTTAAAGANTTVTVDAPASVCAMSVADGAWTISGSSIAIGSGGLSYNSTSTSTISSNLSGAGTISVNAGTLILSGNVSNAVTVNSGATLQGSGSVNGPIGLLSGGTLSGPLCLTGNVNSVGGTIAPGGSTTMTITGSLALDHASALNFALGTPTAGNDNISISGAAFWTAR